ncbi:MAG TPA: NAD-dependent epimerase/dehydratase family protein [Thermoanaerobaculia bacterium]|nr:NAD-dependent epimerase/dehydratase family protein [Thermoanaerobaculia bacterium]
MRVFLTGATGYVGSAVAAVLRDRGHEITALVRPESEARNLREAGAVIVAGDLRSLPDLADTLKGHDAFIHAAFPRSRDIAAEDKIAVDVLSRAGFFVFTSGVWVLGAGKSNESSKVNPIPLVAWRAAHEQAAIGAGPAAVIRPGCVYGGKQSLLAGWFAAADQRKPLQIAGDGNNRWAMVNLHDLADCYVRIVEQHATGIFHAVDDTRATIHECAHVVAPSGKIEHAGAEGPLGQALTIDQDVSSDATRRKLGWTPRRTFTTSIDEQWREWRDALQPAS